MTNKVPANPQKSLAYAISWARRRWGNAGHAWHPQRTVPGDPTRCAVGVKEGIHEHQWRVVGVGADFAEAIEDAETRES